MALLFCMRRVAVLTLGGACLFIASSSAQQPPSGETQTQIEAYVKQLGDDSYQVRERAAEGLRQFGLSTKAALLAAMKSEDLEVARRSRRMWSEVRIDVGWRQAQEILGDSPQARQLFDKMFLSAPNLWYELAETPRPMDSVFDDRQKWLQEAPAEKRLLHWEGDIANLLYFGLRVKSELPQKEVPRFDELLRTGRTQKAIANNEAFAQLVGRWLSETKTDGPALDRLLIAMQERRSQAIDIAREILRSDKATAKEKQYALLALLTTKEADDEKLIEEALGDSSSLDILLTEGQLVKSELRDVALAVQITRNGQSPGAFGFNYLRTDDSTIYSPSSLGFVDSAERDAAFEKWAAFTARQMHQESR